jgi:hypothetical protein
MGRIYKNAGAVPVWLGKYDEEIAGDCFKLVRETVDCMGPQLEQLEKDGITGVNWNLAPAVTICDDGVMQVYELEGSIANRQIIQPPAFIRLSSLLLWPG